MEGYGWIDRLWSAIDKRQLPTFGTDSGEDMEK